MEPDARPKPRKALVDALLSERALLPAAGVALVALLAWVALRPRNYGSATDFNLPVVDDRGGLGDERVRLSDLRGRPVLLDFWATWCGPCRAELPVLVRLHQRYSARGFTVVGVNVDEAGPSLVPQFKRHFNIPYAVVYDLGNAASRAYQVTGLPTLVLIDRSGTVRRRYAGAIPEDTLASAIEGVL